MSEPLPRIGTRCRASALRRDPAPARV